MRNAHKIYLAGSISDISIAEHSEWRDKFQEFIYDCGVDYAIRVFNPVEHIEELAPNKMDERQAMEYDLYMLRNSDLIIMNFNYMRSIGTACELGIAYERRIPVLGLNLEGADLHDWQKIMCSKIFTDWDLMIDYFVKHYIDEWL